MAAPDALPARAFGPGLPGEGAPVTVHLAAGRLVVDGWPDVAGADRRHVKSRRQGDGWLLEWASPAGACAVLLQPADGKGRQALAAWLPAATARHDAATRNWLWTALFLVVGLPVLLVAGFFAFRSEIVDAAVAKIPVAQEQRLADALWAMQRTRLKLIDGTPANRFVESVGARLVQAKPTPYRYRFHVADDASVNAFAMPGGYVVVHRGLIEKAASAEEVAGVLAHEIEHVEQRHSLRGLVQAAGLAAVWAAATGDLGGGSAGKFFQDLAGLDFSREQEASADAGGYERLVAANIDPRGMASFFARLAEGEAKLPSALVFLSTHPASDERAARLKARLADAPAFPPLEADWAAVQAR